MRKQIHERFLRCPECQGSAEKKSQCNFCAGSGLVLDQVDRNYVVVEGEE